MAGEQRLPAVVTLRRRSLQLQRRGSVSDVLALGEAAPRSSQAADTCRCQSAVSANNIPDYILIAYTKKTAYRRKFLAGIEQHTKLLDALERGVVGGSRGLKKANRNIVRRITKFGIIMFCKILINI